MTGKNLGLKRRDMVHVCERACVSVCVCVCVCVCERERERALATRAVAKTHSEIKYGLKVKKIGEGWQSPPCCFLKLRLVYTCDKNSAISLSGEISN